MNEWYTNSNGYDFPVDHMIMGNITLQNLAVFSITGITQVP